MKNLSIFNKFIFIINSLLATALLLSYLSYYISPINYPKIAIISLSTPVLLLVNMLFVVYWLIQFKKQFLLSLVVLLIEYQSVANFFQLTEKKIFLNSDISIMSYNVRMFNVYHWINKKNMAKNIYSLINESNPDILCLQEFKTSKKLGFDYPYKYIKLSPKNPIFGQAIFSKYKIINAGSLNFTKSTNNAIYADIVIKSDTIRVYTIHLESFKLDTRKVPLENIDREKLLNRLKKAFPMQTSQVKLLKMHQDNSPFRNIICGDFNNTAFSWVYHQLSQGKNDAFTEAGSGFGRTYDFMFPFRIDFILMDKAFEINNFKTLDEKYSDHYPIIARFSLPKKIHSF